MEKPEVKNLKIGQYQNNVEVFVQFCKREIKFLKQDNE
jgi:hypothetical protein